LTIHFGQELPIYTANGLLISESVWTKREDATEIRFFASLKPKAKRRLHHQLKTVRYVREVYLWILRVTE